MNEKLKAVLASYARTAVSAALAVYMTGNTDAKAMATAALAAIVGPLARALNPKDGAFGIVK
jgi:predicted P-loop ATPase